MNCTILQLPSRDKLQDEPVATTKALGSIVQKVAKARKVIFAVGAGISTSAGIADFRTKDQGLYAKSTRGPAMFTSDVYASEVTRTQHWQFVTEMQHTTQMVLDRAAALKQPSTATHGFMRTMKRRGTLLRVYTQNIDGFEQTAGLKEVGIEGIGLAETLGDGKVQVAPSVKGKGKAVEIDGDFIQLHGSLHRVRCSACAWVGKWTQAHTAAFEQGMSVDCPACQEQSDHRARQSKRRIPNRSYVRPSIVLYNENSPAAATIGSISISDLSSSPDLLIVAGTTLRIPGFKRLVREFSKAVKSRGGICVFVNREEASREWHSIFDYQVIGSCDDFCERITADWRRTRPSDWTTQSSLSGLIRSSKLTIAAPSAKPPLSPTRSPLRELPTNTLGSPRRDKRAAPFDLLIQSPTRNKKLKTAEYSSPPAPFTSRRRAQNPHLSPTTTSQCIIID